jgi:hypothetical protein
VAARRRDRERQRSSCKACATRRCHSRAGAGAHRISDRRFLSFSRPSTVPAGSLANAASVGAKTVKLPPCSVSARPARGRHEWGACVRQRVCVRAGVRARGAAARSARPAPVPGCGRRARASHAACARPRRRWQASAASRATAPPRWWRQRSRAFRVARAPRALDRARPRHAALLCAVARRTSSLERGHERLEVAGRLGGLHDGGGGAGRDDAARSRGAAAGRRCQARGARGGQVQGSGARHGGGWWGGG